MRFLHYNKNSKISERTNKKNTEKGEKTEKGVKEVKEVRDSQTTNRMVEYACVCTTRDIHFRLGIQKRSHRILARNYKEANLKFSCTLARKQKLGKFG